MRFVSIRIITDDVPRLVAFYEQVTETTATWSADVFAELTVSSFTLAIASSRTVPLFGPGCAQAAANRTVITEFIVDDVGAEYERIKGITTDFVNEPTTMPWGNRALLFRDPDGNLVNLFTPVTPDAIAKFGR